MILCIYHVSIFYEHIHEKIKIKIVEQVFNFT